ncbi:hypothetical protein [Microbacterium sp.]|uniref:hypothetical protein n=1 Tax=Microbacterium sp. TaxID=51671 RepID=UPI003F971958
MTEKSTAELIARLAHAAGSPYTQPEDSETIDEAIRVLEGADRELAEERERIASEIEADVVYLDDGSVNAFGAGEFHAARIVRADRIEKEAGQ